MRRSQSERHPVRITLGQRNHQGQEKRTRQQENHSPGTPSAGGSGRCGTILPSPQQQPSDQQGDKHSVTILRIDPPIVPDDANRGHPACHHHQHGEHDPRRGKCKPLPWTLHSSFFPPLSKESSPSEICFLFCGVDATCRPGSLGDEGSYKYLTSCAAHVLNPKC